MQENKSICGTFSQLQFLTFKHPKITQKKCGWHLANICYVFDIWFQALAAVSIIMVVEPGVWLQPLQLLHWSFLLIQKWHSFQMPKNIFPRIPCYFSIIHIWRHFSVYYILFFALFFFHIGYRVVYHHNSYLVQIIL